MESGEQDFKQRLLALDIRLSAWLGVAERPGLLRTAAVVFAHSGDSWFWLAGLGLLWILGNEYWRERAAAFALCILLTAVLVLLVKFTVRRRRPDGEWGGIYRQTDPHSFPSGHAARSIMLAVLAIGLGPTWLAVLLLVWAPLVCLARIAMGVHYLSDVVAGAILGCALGLVYLSFFQYFFSPPAALL